MAMFPPNAIPGKKLNPGPSIEEYLKLLDVPNYKDTVQDITEEDMLMSAMASQMGMGGQSGGVPAMEQGAEAEKETISTPVGETLAAPGDNTNITKAIDNAQVQ
jgi:hypothetical protein